MLKVKNACSGDRDDTMTKYIFLLKDQKEMQSLFNNAASRGIVSSRDTIYYLSCNKDGWKLKDTIFSNYIKQNDDTSFYSQAERIIDVDVQEKSFKPKHIKLTFVNYHDNLQKQNFLPFIYQEADNVDNNCLLVYDIINKCISDPVQINPTTST